MQRTKLLFPSAAWPVILWLLFAGTYAAIFFIQRASFIEQYQYTVSRIPSVMLYGSDMVKTLEQYGSSYGGFAGIAIGFVYAVLAYALLGIFSVFRLTKQKFGAMLAFLIAVLPLDALAYFIHFQPRPRTAISSALAHFIGIPFWFTTLSLTAVLGLLLILSFVYGASSSTSEKLA